MKYSLTLFASFFFCLALFGQDSTAAVKRSPFILGTTIELPSKLLGEKRVVNIYLPAGYDAKDSINYPVVYLLDGSADEDFIHIAGLMQFANFPWVAQLPASILVGIANTDRRRDFTYPTTIEKDRKDFPTTGGSQAFMRYIGEELQPFIQREYKTTSSKTIIGQSLGGLLATEILFKKPELFTHYIIVSPSLWWDKESLLKVQSKVTASGFRAPVTVAVAVGKEGPVMEADSRQLVNLLRKSQKKNLKVSFQYFPAEDHGTILHKAVYWAFEAMYPKLKK
ncbi:MAG: putative esterase [Flaviaesturariibacter sp.]|nr:putative esterase [Flaviaesturariibacter sp.]